MLHTILILITKNKFIMKKSIISLFLGTCHSVIVPMLLISLLFSMQSCTKKRASTTSKADTVEEYDPSQSPDNKNTTEVADTCETKRGIYLLTPEEFANVNETPEDSFLLDGKYISFENFKKIDMDSIAYIGIFSTSKEDRMKQISGEHKGRSFYVFSKKMAEEGKLMKYYNIDIRVNRQDRIMLDTDYVNLSDLSDSIKKQVNYPDRTIAYLQVSKKASQSTVSAIKEILQKNGILKVVYSVHKESDK